MKKLTFQEITQILPSVVLASYNERDQVNVCLRRPDNADLRLLDQFSEACGYILYDVAVDDNKLMYRQYRQR